MKVAAVLLPSNWQKISWARDRDGLAKELLINLKEWIVALKLEKNFTKQEILSLYLNRVSWGNIFGIRNASRVYFQKEPSELNYR